MSKRSTPNSKNNNTPLPKVAKCQSDPTILSELLAIVLRKFKKEDLNSAKKVSRQFANVAKSAQNARVKNTPRMKQLLSFLVDFTNKAYSNAQIIMVHKFVITAKNSSGNNGFTLTYDSECYNNNRIMNDNTNNIISIKRIKDLIFARGFHAAQFTTDEEEEEFQDLARNAVLDEYSERYANYLDDIVSFNVAEFSLKNISNNTNSNVTKTNLALTELTSFLSTFSRTTTS
jgi:hypothetical protein